MCEATKKRTSDDALIDFAERFTTTCQAREDVLAGASHLDRAKKKLEAFRVAKGSVNQHYRDSEVRGALKQAEEALGPDNVDLVETRRAYKEEFKPRSAAILRVRAFMARPAVRTMRNNIDKLQAEVRALEKDAKYSEHSRVLLGQRRSDLRAAESKYSRAMTEAKL